MKKDKPAICCVGHITLDKIVTPGHEPVYMPGGTAFYFAHGMASLGNRDFRLITSLASSEMKAVDDMRARNIDVEVIPSEKSVYFENIYSGKSQSDRSQRVLAKARPFTIESLRDAEAGIFHLGTLLADDFSVDVIEYLASKGYVAADAQGYLREVRGQQVHAVDWEEKREALKHISIIKANQMEMEVIAGTSDPREAARLLSEWGAREVIFTFDDKGSLIYSKGNFYEIPAYPTSNVVDATGCGDTYMTGYLHRRAQGDTPAEAGAFAAAMCTITLGYSGPFKGTEADVFALQNRFKA